MEQDHLISNQVYNVLKPVVTIALPALATLYVALAQIWGLPNPVGVVATITALTTFLGVFLGISATSWNNSSAKYDGSLVMSNPDPDDPSPNPNIQLELNKDPADLAGKRTVRLRTSDLRSG